MNEFIHMAENRKKEEGYKNLLIPEIKKYDCMFVWLYD